MSGFIFDKEILYHRIKSTAASVSLGVLIAGVIMGLASTGVFHIIGL